MNTLTQKTFTAVVWNFSGTFGTQAIQFLTTLILARLLSPAEFGLVGMLMAFTLIASSLVDGGFGAALIQQSVTHLDESAVFYFNMLIAVCLYAAFWWLAIPIAGFYQQPELVSITRALSLIFPFNALGLVQSSLFTKHLNFRAQTHALMLATFISGIIGVTMAVRHYGVWSLVGQSVSNALLRSVFLWAFSAWRPLRRFHLTSLRAMFPYGARLLVSGLLGTMFDNIYPIIIGKFFAQSEVGFYSRAQLTQRQAADSLTSVVANVSFPAYAALQHDPQALRAGYRQSIRYTSVVLFPLMLGLAAMATPLFLLLFSAKWAPSIPYFQVLCLSGMLYHLHALNLGVMKATGRADLYLRVSVIKLVIAVAGLLIACRFGMPGIVWGQVAISWIGLTINTLYTGTIIAYSLRDQLVDTLPYAAISAASAGIVYLVSLQLAHLAHLLQIGVLLPLLLVLYLGLARLFGLYAPFELLARVRAHCIRRPAGEVAAV